jgi:ADP-ribose pyrophosphatase
MAAIPAIMSDMAYTLREKSTLYAGSRISLELQRFEDELSGKIVKREVVIHLGSVVVLPFTTGGQQPTRNDQILLIRNMRQGLGKYLIELPAGTLEKGEAPINCAGRELQEETGHLAQKLVPIGSFYASPGVLTEKLYAFAAYDLTQTVTHLDDGEEIEVLPVKYLDALEMIRTGEIEDAKTIATLLMYALMFKH